MWVVISLFTNLRFYVFRGFRSSYHVKSLYAGRTYKFRLCLESNDKTGPTSNVATICSCTTKSSFIFIILKQIYKEPKGGFDGGAWGICPL